MIVPVIFVSFVSNVISITFIVKLLNPAMNFQPSLLRVEIEKDIFLGFICQ